MEKTKLGISVGLMGALTYFAGLFSGYTVAVLVVGYILLVEQNEWLRKTAIKAISLMLVFSVIGSVIGLIPGLFNVIDNMCNIFGGYFNYGIISKLVNFVQSVVNYAETIVFLLLGLMALRMKTFDIPVIDTVVDEVTK